MDFKIGRTPLLGSGYPLNGQFQSLAAVALRWMQDAAGSGLVKRPLFPISCGGGPFASSRIPIDSDWA